MALTENEIKLNSDGEAWRPHLYIDDACKVIEFAINYKKKKSDDKILILNVGRNDNNLRVIDVVQIIKKLIPRLKISYLKKSGKNLKDKIFLDRKIKDGRDSRTYKVSFNNLNKKFGAICNYTVELLIKKMIRDLDKINFNKNIFKFNGFYRLQYLDELYEKKKINKDFKWLI